MSEHGVFAVDRGIFSDPDFAPEPFTEREAFLWLVSEAAWKPHTRRQGRAMIKLERGQLCHAVRFMADIWKWSKSRVDRFLTRLKNRDMIKINSGTKISIISICNYEIYQRVSLPERDKVGTESGTAAGQSWDKLEYKENKEYIILTRERECDPMALSEALEKAGNGRITIQSLMVVGEIIELIANGVSLEIDILPTISAISSKLNKQVSLSYFIGAIRSAYEKRVAAGSGLPKQKPLSTTNDDWEKRLKYARRMRLWSEAEYGPPPGRNGCQVPPVLILDGDGEGWADISTAKRRAG